MVSGKREHGTGEAGESGTASRSRNLRSRKFGKIGRTRGVTDLYITECS